MTKAGEQHPYQPPINDDGSRSTDEPHQHREQQQDGPVRSSASPAKRDSSSELKGGKSQATMIREVSNQRKRKRQHGRNRHQPPGPAQQRQDGKTETQSDQNPEHHRRESELRENDAWRDHDSVS